jgi:Ca2+-transporting ATPase
VLLVLGPRRIARSHLLTRRFPAIEALGAATVQCVDKTALTQNRMSVVRLWRADAQRDVDSGALPPALHHLAELGMLASQVRSICSTGLATWP